MGKVILVFALNFIINNTGTDGDPEVAEEEASAKHIGPYVRSFSSS